MSQPTTGPGGAAGGGSGVGAAPESLDEAFFNQGYYAKFFREERKLGHGLRGTVFLARHVMHEVELGWYAIKKVPVGMSVRRPPSRQRTPCRVPTPDRGDP